MTETLEKPMASGVDSAGEMEAITSPEKSGTIRLGFEVSPRRAAWILSGCALVLAFCHVVTVVWNYEYSELPWAFRSLFDLDEEASFGTWFSSGILLIAGLCAMLCGKRASATGRPRRFQWWFLGYGFVVLSIDEIAGMHESLNTVTEMSWAVPGGILAVLVGLAYAPFLFCMPRKIAVLFLVAGIVYVGGAVGVELATEGFLVGDQLDTVEYNLTTALEEGMEMGGVIIMIYALLRYLSWDGGIQAGVVVGSDPHG